MGNTEDDPLTLLAVTFYVLSLNRDLESHFPEGYTTRLYRYIDAHWPEDGAAND